MFDNLTQREKVLATLVVSLIPLALFVMGLFWFFGQRSTRDTQIAGLRSQIELEEQRLTDALNANQRRVYYRGVSLPSKLSDASNDYLQWVKELARDKVGMKFKSITPRPPIKLKFDNVNVIGQTQTFTLLATAEDLNQLVDFLTQFYQLDLLHRINSITLNPTSSGRDGIRSGKISVNAVIEVLSLADADAERDDFVKQFRELDAAPEAYRNAILKRNIFGPANNTPTLTVSKSSSYYSDKDLRIPINANDADKNQNLTFNILNSPIESAKLEPKKKPTDRRVYMTVPKQPAGEYTFKIQVSDDGYPAKSNETEFKINVKEKVAKKPPKKKPPKPEFNHARETRITAIVKDKSGTWQVWINVRTKGEKHKLAVGDSFTLDGQEWQVTSIAPDKASFMVDGDEKTFRRNAVFDGTEKEASIKG